MYAVMFSNMCDIFFTGFIFFFFGFAISNFFTIYFVSLDFFLSIIPSVLETDASSDEYLFLYNWIELGSILIKIEFTNGNFSNYIGFIVLFITLIIQFFSFTYMNHEKDELKFQAFLSFFSVFMYILLSSENVVQFFAGWEGIGICSYLLISFWSTRVDADLAALKAIYTNKIGDLAMLLAIVFIFYETNSFEFNIIEFSIQLIKYSSLFEYLCFLLSIAVISKSAQFSMHLWLPDAMEGPTPVSAFIHAATMVTAGILLVIKFNFLFKVAVI